MKQVVSFDPQVIAQRYYFGDLSYWQLPDICVQALEHGFDGRALRIIAGLATDLRSDDIDLAFREMGVDAPIPNMKRALRLLPMLFARRFLGNRTCLMRLRTSESICAIGMMLPWSCSLSSSFLRDRDTRPGRNGIFWKSAYVKKCPIS